MCQVSLCLVFRNAELSRTVRELQAKLKSTPAVSRPAQV